jgi:hypothetical protein
MNRNSSNKFFTLRYAFDNKCGHGILAAKEVAPGSAVYIAVNSIRKLKAKIVI